MSALYDVCTISESPNNTFLITQPYCSVVCDCTDVYWNGARHSLRSPPFLAGRASDFQGREQTVSHTQQACKYLLPNL